MIDRSPLPLPPLFRLALASAISLTACAGEDGAAGISSLVSIGVEPAGASCPAGGTRIDTGVDDDGDGALGAAEIDATTYVCNGTSGTTSLVALTDVPLGAVCAEGGTDVHHGVDDDASGTLEPAEYDGSTTLCDGVVVDASCAAIKARHPTTPDGVYTLELARGDTLAYCDMTGATVTYAGLGFGLHGATYAGWAEISVADLQVAARQQAFIALYNGQGGGAINLAPGFYDSNCCFRAADSAANEYLFLGPSYVYPATVAGATQCGGGYNDATYRLTLDADGAATVSPSTLPATFFTTYPATNGDGCSADGNPALFWGTI